HNDAALCSAEFEAASLRCRQVAGCPQRDDLIDLRSDPASRAVPRYPRKLRELSPMALMGRLPCTQNRQLVPPLSGPEHRPHPKATLPAAVAAKARRLDHHLARWPVEHRQNSTRLNAVQTKHQRSEE